MPLPYNYKTFSFLIILLSFSSVIYFFSFNTADPDLWGHLKFGEDLWTSKTIPKVDIYSYTAFGQEWINHEWLTELLFYKIFDLSGSAGLLIGKLAIGCFIICFTLLVGYHRKRTSLISGLVIVMAVSIMSSGFMTRPQVITFLFTSCYFFIFYLYLDRRENLLWALPIIMVVWVNSHGGFIIGAGLFPVVILSETISCYVKGVDKNHLKNLIIWFVITEISLLVNPYGLRLFQFLYESLSESRAISEWKPVTLLDFSYLRLKIFSILIIFSFLIDKKNNRYWEISIIVISMLYAFLQQRHTVIFAIVATPFLIEKMSIVEDRLGLLNMIYSVTSYILIIISLVLLIGYQLSHAIEKYRDTDLNIIVDPNIYPVAAVSFLRENNIKGDIIVPFEWGEYVIWKLYPDSRVSIDGRFRTVYSNKIIDDHFNANTYEKWIELLDKYPATIVLARRNSISEKFVNNENNWIYVYSDAISFIFLKDMKENREYINKLTDKKIIYPESIGSIFFP